MKEDSVVSIEEPTTNKDVLTEVLREGAQKLLAEAVQAELEELLEEYREERDGEGRQRLVRNGYLPGRKIQTGIGGISVRVPRVRDRGSGQESEEIIRFRSGLVPPYLRRSKSLEELLPLLYLKGISTGDFTDALSARCWVRMPRDCLPRASAGLKSSGFRTTIGGGSGICPRSATSMSGQTACTAMFVSTMRDCVYWCSWEPVLTERRS